MLIAIIIKWAFGNFQFTYLRDTSRYLRDTSYLFRMCTYTRFVNRERRMFSIMTVDSKWALKHLCVCCNAFRNLIINVKWLYKVAVLLLFEKLYS